MKKEKLKKILPYAILVVLIALAILFKSFKYTGHAIGTLSQEQSSFVSAAIIIVSLIIVFLFYWKRK